MLWRPFLDGLKRLVHLRTAQKVQWGYMELIADAHLVLVYNFRPRAAA